MEPIWETLLLCWTGNLHQPPECRTSAPPAYATRQHLSAGQRGRVTFNKQIQRQNGKSSLASCLHSQHISPTGKQSTCWHLNCVLSTEVPWHQESVAGGTGKENASFWAQERLNSFSRCFPHNQSPKPSMSSQSSFSTVIFWRLPSNVTAQSVFLLKTSPLFPANHLKLAFSP